MADGAPLGIAGLWNKWRSPAREWIESYTMLTISADQHPLFKDYHPRSACKRARFWGSQSPLRRVPSQAHLPSRCLGAAVGASTTQGLL